MVEHELLDGSELISLDRGADLHRILVDCGLLAHSDEIHGVEVAGEGNMNCTLRVRVAGGSFVVKQSRPWVEKYPSIPAPMNRALFEIQFYETVARSGAVVSKMPRLIGFDRERHLLLLDDLGAGRDGTFLYSRSDMDCLKGQLPSLAQWLADLHSISVGPDFENFTNRELRKLNHAHIFEIPFFHPPAIDLDAVTPGLDGVAKEYSVHAAVVSRARQLGEEYLADGETLLHGDFFPGSWLFTSEGLFVIDPEFCFCGRPEFDLAVCSAHLRMIGLEDESIDDLLANYEQKSEKLDRRLVNAWAGIEIMRRILGVAQLGLDRSLDEKRELLSWAEQAVLA